MNTNTLLDPSSLFINENDWFDETKRDEFLSHLLDNLHYINDFQISKIYWSDELESLIWEDPQTPPWRIERDFKMQLVPVIFDLFSKNTLIITPNLFLNKCIVAPTLNYNCSNVNATHLFDNLVHHVVEKNEAVFLCLGMSNSNINSIPFEFECSCHGKLYPLSIYKPDDWINYIDLVNSHWPVDYSELSIQKFTKALELTAIMSFDTNKFLYKVEFEKNFIKDLISEIDYREEILYNIAKRLISDQKTSSNDKSLDDEPVKRIRRFRVTLSNRIHYDYTSEGEIRFLNYYCSSEHDKGLR